MSSLTGERIPKVLKTKLNLARMFICRNSRVCRDFVLIIGLAVFFLFSGQVAHAEAVYLFTKTMGGTDQDLGQSVAVDGSGNVYITGSFRGTADFDPGPAIDNHTAVGLEDIFLTKINADGSYGYTRTMGGTDDDEGQSVAVDSSGNVYITGYFSGANVNFNPGGVADYHTSAGLEDIFLTKINADGSYGHTRTMGGTDHDEGQSVAMDGSDNVYITGYFSGVNTDFNPGGVADYHTSAGLEDIFLTKINADGSYGYTRTMGGTDHDEGQSVAVDGSDNVYITGYFSGTNADFNPGGVADSHTSAGLEDIFLTKINYDGSYGYTKTMGGTGSDYGRSVALDSIDNVYITGSFQETVDFDPGSGTDNHTSKGLDDIFLTKINFDGSYDLTKTMGGTGSDYGRSVAVDDAVNVYITGSFQETVDFDPGTGTDSYTSAGLDDIYLTKFRMVGFIVVPTSLTTTGSGGTATFAVKLLSEPSADVTLPVSSSDSSIGTVDKSSLTFTNADWFVDQTVTITSVTANSQTYNIVLGPASSADADYNGLNAQNVTVSITGNASGGSISCFIAAAAYGSPLARYVQVLRQFRDRFLLTNGMGRRLVHFYYTHSPLMASFIKKHDHLRALVRLALIPFVGAGWLILKIGFAAAMALVFFFGIGLIGLSRYIMFKNSS
jgi:Beta-propeller repeat